jgi:hypothetical protein
MRSSSGVAEESPLAEIRSVIFRMASGMVEETTGLASGVVISTMTLNSLTYKCSLEDIWG